MATEQFNIHASVVFQLGETLITDENQALVELVKNSYDAEATKVRLHIDTKNSMPPGSAFPDALGFILIDDNGVGMDIGTIRQGWLTISNSIKREQKRRGKFPADRRTPLGDKGLGRLGAQRLGHNIEIWTRPQGGEVEYHVSFSWREFYNKALLQDVPVSVHENHQPKRKPGTRIIISDLVDSNFWKGADATKHLQNELAQMLSPYEEVQNFKVDVSVDESPIDLVKVAQQVRQTAELHYSLSFKQEKLTVNGKARLNYFRPERPESNWQDLAEADKGQKFFDFLSDRRPLKDYQLRLSTDPGWFIEFSFEQPFDEIAGMERVGELLASPGPFSGEIDSFDLGRTAIQQQNSFSGNEYREMVRSLSGIRVFRNGFGIRVGQDWLGLGEQQTSARSYYGLRPGNVMGYIALSARDNAELEETTNRQDFVQNAYYRNFVRILKAWLQFTAQVQNSLRRTWVAFESEARLPELEDKSPEGLSRSLTESLSHARSAAKPLTTLRTTLEQTVNNARRAVQSAKTGSSLYAIEEQDRHNLEASVKAFETNASEVEETTKRLDDVVVNLETLEVQSHVLREQVGGLREQIAETYEVVSLGITAEALSHEIFNITDRLADQTRWIRTELKTRNIVIAEVVTYLERVSSSILNLRKQLNHLDPSLKYLRERRDTIELLSFFREQEEFFHDRFAKNNIHVDLLDRSRLPFIIQLNKGKLVQVVDNLFLNSEFWLREEMRLGRLQKGVITVELDAPYLRIYDNGPGIASQIENSVFEPFVSMKERGRGLGLFIISQLLETEGCQVDLLPSRNEAGRLYIFDINLAPVQTEKPEENG